MGLYSAISVVGWIRRFGQERSAKAKAARRAGAGSTGGALRWLGALEWGVPIQPLTFRGGKRLFSHWFQKGLAIRMTTGGVGCWCDAKTALHCSFLARWLGHGLWSGFVARGFPEAIANPILLEGKQVLVAWVAGCKLGFLRGIHTGHPFPDIFQDSACLW